MISSQRNGVMKGLLELDEWIFGLRASQINCQPPARTITARVGSLVWGPKKLEHGSHLGCRWQGWRVTTELKRPEVIHPWKGSEFGFGDMSWRRVREEPCDSKKKKGLLPTSEMALFVSDSLHRCFNNSPGYACLFLAQSSLASLTATCLASESPDDSESLSQLAKGSFPWLD